MLRSGILDTLRLTIEHICFMETGHHNTIHPLKHHMYKWGAVRQGNIIYTGETEVIYNIPLDAEKRCTVNYIVGAFDTHNMRCVEHIT